MIFLKCFRPKDFLGWKVGDIYFYSHRGASYQKFTRKKFFGWIWLFFQLWSQIFQKGAPLWEWKYISPTFQPKRSLGLKHFKNIKFHYNTNRSDFNIVCVNISSWAGRGKNFVWVKEFKKEFEFSSIFLPQNIILIIFLWQFEKSYFIWDWIK